MRRVSAFLLTATLAAASAAPSAGWAQTALPPAPVETAPLPAPASPVPAPPGPASPPPATLTQTPAPAAPAAPPVAAPAVGTAATTLIPQPGDPGDVDEVVLPEKPVLVLSGTSKWEDGLKNLRAAFGKLQAELSKEGVAVAGRPLAVFVQTNDDDFRFDAMVPVALQPTPAPTLPEGMRYGTTPSGKAYRFVHKGPYDDIDATYETITAYLDAKDVTANDAFVEEYVDDITDPADPNLTINIFVQPK